MKKIILFISILAFCSISMVSAQNVRFSFDVDNTQGPFISIVNFYAEYDPTADPAENPNCAGYTAVFYYDAGEATTASGDVDYTPTSDLGWNIAGATTYSNEPADNPNVPITHTNRIEIGVLDFNFLGTDFPETPTLLLTVTFNKEAGTPEYGGEVYSGATGDTDPGIVYTDWFFNGWPVEFTGGRQGVLPLDLISFDVEKYGARSSSIKWTTANEVNTSHFNVQRSVDKRTWQTAGKVQAAGNSQAVLNYGFIDENVYNGVDDHLAVYYRLQMVDLDGKFKVSPIDRVIFGSGGDKSRAFEASVFPNPATEGIYLTWSNENIDQPTSIELYDVTGKLMLQQDVAPNSNQEYVDLTPVKLQPGLYLVRMLDGTEPLTNQQIVVGQRR